MRRRWIGVLTVAAAAVVFTFGPGNTQPKTYTVATAVANKTIPFDSHIDGLYDTAFKKHSNLRHIALDGQGKVERQIAVIEDMIARKVDFLVVKPIEEKALPPTAVRRLGQVAPDAFRNPLTGLLSALYLGET